MIKRIDHGSTNIIEKPCYELGKKHNEYGRGFYCTEDINMAKEWGVKLHTSGYANIYEIDTADLEVLNLHSSSYSILPWFAILLENRIFSIESYQAYNAKKYILDNFLVPYKDTDIIIGYRADNGNFSYAQDFISGVINLRQLNNALKLEREGEQFVIKSKKAFDKLQFIGSEKTEVNDWYDKMQKRDCVSRSEYLNYENYQERVDDIKIDQIIKQGIKKDDIRLQ